MIPSYSSRRENYAFSRNRREIKNIAQMRVFSNPSYPVLTFNFNSVEKKKYEKEVLKYQQKLHDLKLEELLWSVNIQVEE